MVRVKRTQFSLSLPKEIADFIIRYAEENNLNESHAVTQLICKVAGFNPSHFDSIMNKPRKRAELAPLKDSKKPFPKSMDELRADPYRSYIEYENLLVKGYCWNLNKGERVTEAERAEIIALGEVYAI